MRATEKWVSNLQTLSTYTTKLAKTDTENYVF